MEDPILACSELAVGYGGRTVASGIGFAVASGQCVCVVGENGAGKSTLLRTLLGLQPALAGEIRRGGDVRPGDIGYLPQQNPVQGDFPATAREVALSGVQAARGLRPFFRAADRHARARGRARALLRDVGRLDGAPRNRGEGRRRMTAAFDTLRQYLAFPFVQNALMAGLLIALAAALLGVTLVLRRLSYIGRLRR